MAKHPHAVDDHPITAYLQGRLTRAQLLKAAGAGVALAATPAVAGAAAPSTSFPYFPQGTSGTYTTETAQEIVANILTLKYFDVTTTVPLLSNPTALASLGITGSALTIVQAIVAQEQYQIDWLQTLVPGVAPLSMTFTFDPSLISNAQSFATVGLFLSNVYVGADLTAARELAELGQPTLAKNMAQLMAADAENLAAFRTLLFLSGSPGLTPPDNKAFETDLFLYTRDAIAMFKQLGFIGGKGLTFTYPGRAAALTATGSMAGAIIQKAPNNAGSTVTFTSFASFGGERT
jgi:hypothetical protein